MLFAMGGSVFPGGGMGSPWVFKVRLVNVGFVGSTNH